MLNSMAVAYGAMQEGVGDDLPYMKVGRAVDGLQRPQLEDPHRPGDEVLERENHDIRDDQGIDGGKFHSRLF
jgi:hypothetical protein